MDTKVWTINLNQQADNSYREAAEFLCAGEVVAFPTETVYGLGGDATNEQAIQKIYQAKGRPSDNPLIVHIARQEQMNDFIDYIPEKAQQLIDAFCPGPVTLILPLKKNKLATNVTAGLDSVGVRIPGHPVALKLLQKTNLPIAAPSANSSGRPSPTTAQHVAEDLTGKIAGLIDGGNTGVGIESTVIDCTTETPAILRPGGISIEQIEAVIGEVKSVKSVANINEAPKAPGMKYTHYAPKAPVYLISGSSTFFLKQIKKAKCRGEKIGLLISKELESELDTNEQTVITGTKSNMSSIAKSLYGGLRSFDHTDVTLIFAETYARIGIGEAVMNRLEKAAGHHYLLEQEK